jgi:hypothetical protein
VIFSRTNSRANRYNSRANTPARRIIACYVSRMMCRYAHILDDGGCIDGGIAELLYTVVEIFDIGSFVALKDRSDSIKGSKHCCFLLYSLV